MHRRVWRIGLAGSLGILLSVVACDRPAAPAKDTSAADGAARVKPDGGAAAEQKPAKPVRVGFSQCTVTEPWRVEFNRRLAAYAGESWPQVELTILDANDQTEQQVAQVKSFIEREMDAILISPKESAGLTDVVREAVEAGIIVVVLDRDVRYDEYQCFVGGDNFLIGRTAGRVAIDMLGGPGKATGVIYELCGGLASTPGQERRDGFHKELKKEPGVQIIGGLDCDWKKDQAQRTFQDALKAHERIDLVYAHNDPMAHGAYQAAKAAGRAEEMKFIGIDALPDEGLHWVRSGELTATLLYPTPGEKGLEMAMCYLGHCAKERYGPILPRRVTLPTRVFTRDNVDSGGRVVGLDTP